MKTPGYNWGNVSWSESVPSHRSIYWNVSWSAPSHRSIYRNVSWSAPSHRSIYRNVSWSAPSHRSIYRNVSWSAPSHRSIYRNVSWSAPSHRSIYRNVSWSECALSSEYLLKTGFYYTLCMYIWSGFLSMDGLYVSCMGPHRKYQLGKVQRELNVPSSHCTGRVSKRPHTARLWRRLSALEWPERMALWHAEQYRTYYCSQDLRILWTSGDTSLYMVTGLLSNIPFNAQTHWVGLLFTIFPFDVVFLRPGRSFLFIFWRFPALSCLLGYIIIQRYLFNLTV